VYWSESGELVALACADTTYVLRFSREAYLEGLNAGLADEDGVESAFEVVTDIQESIRTGEWVGDCFIYTNSTNRLNYLVGDQTYTIAHFDQGMYLLGYLPRDGKLYLADKDVGIVSYALSLTVVEYQTLVLRGDIDGAQGLLADIPQDQMNKIARFLEGQGYKELALEVATDPEHRFELALSLNNLQIALEIAKEADAEHRWKVVGDAALAAWDVKLAEECFRHAKDLGSLLLLHSSTGNIEGLKQLVRQADTAGANNVAFSGLWLQGDIDGCIDLLVLTGRVAEAVLFSQTYKPSRTVALVGEWKTGLEKAGRGRVGRLIGVPGEDEELFPEWDEYIKLEEEASSKTNGNLVDVDGVNGAAENGHAEETVADDEDATADTTEEAE
jgi:coatomer subunit beta'